jgi:hypothetical protein
MVTFIFDKLQQYLLLAPFSIVHFFLHFRFVRFLDPFSHLFLLTSRLESRSFLS